MATVARPSPGTRVRCRDGRSPPARRARAGLGAGTAAATKETRRGLRARLWLPGHPGRLPAETLTQQCGGPSARRSGGLWARPGSDSRHLPRAGFDGCPPGHSGPGLLLGAPRGLAPGPEQGAARRVSGPRRRPPACKARTRAQRSTGRAHLSPASSSSAAMAAVLRKRRDMPPSRLTGRLGRPGRRRP